MQYSVADHKLKHSYNSTYIYLTSYNAIFEIDSNIEQLLHDIYIQDRTYTQSTLLSYFPGSDKEKHNLFLELLQKKLLLPSNILHGKEVKPELPSNISLQTLVLHLTNQCNFACDYCYLSNDDKINTSVNSYQMNYQTAKQAVNFLLDNSGDQDNLTLVLFGGEPLLNFDVISNIIPYAQKQSNKYKKSINFAVTTNGSLLSKEKIKFLVENDVSITVSLDGPPEIQDKHRRFRNGNPTYHSITSNIKELVSELNGSPLVARSTILDFPQNLDFILTHLLNLGFLEVGISPVLNGQNEQENQSNYIDAFLNEFISISQIFLDAAKNDQFLGFSNIIDLLVTLHEGDIKDYPCGAGLNLFSVDPDGYLYLCQRFTGNVDACMGDINNGFYQNRLIYFRNNSHVNLKKLCKNCLVRSICAGGCYYEAQSLDNGLFTPNQQYCHWINNWFEIGLDLYTKLLQFNPNFLDKLSMLRNKYPIFSDLSS